MGVLWHRELTWEDVSAAHLLLRRHQLSVLYGHEPFCASATHLVEAQSWPCPVAGWAHGVLAAEDRGVAGGARPDVERLPA